MSSEDQPVDAAQGGETGAAGEYRGVIVTEDPNGALIIGDDQAVAEFVARWQQDGEMAVMGTSPLVGSDRGSAISIAASLGATAADTAQYVRLARPRGGRAGDKVVIREWVYRDGRIVSNKAINPATLVQVNPAVTLGVIAVRAALAQSTQEITDAIRHVEATAEEVLRLASADRVGDVKGHYRVLRRRVAQLDGGAPLTGTDWSTVASLGPTLEVGVERLRDYASRLVADLPIEVRADERARRLERVVTEGRLGEVLRLLVIAEQSLYLWQRLRIERVQHAEPEHLDRAVDDAHYALAEHWQADSELAHRLHRVLTDYSALRPLEVHRKLSGRKLQTRLTALRGDLEYFVSARSVQIGRWDPLVAPTVRDAIEAAKTVALESGRSLRDLGGKVVDGGLAGIERTSGAVQAKTAQWRGRMHHEPSDSSPPGETPSTDKDDSRR